MLNRQMAKWRSVRKTLQIITFENIHCIPCLKIFTMLQHCTTRIVIGRPSKRLCSGKSQWMQDLVKNTFTQISNNVQTSKINNCLIDLGGKKTRRFNLKQVGTQ